MSILSDYSEKKLLDHLLVNTAATPAATLYFGLFTADPGESGVTSEFTIGAGAYARAVVTNNITNFEPCAITGTPTKRNSSVITWPAATTAWGTATHWAIYDAATAGNMIAHGAFPASYVIQIGSTPKINIGGMVITASNGASGGLTDYTKRKLLDLWFGAVTYTPPALVYLGVGTALTGETLTEWTDANYARQATAFTAATLGVGTCPNSSTETFASPSAAAGPTTLTHYGIWDDLSAGNLLATGSLNSSKVIALGDTADLAAGAAVVTFQ